MVEEAILFRWQAVECPCSRMSSQGNSASIPAKLVMLHTGVVEEGVVAVDRVVVVEGGWQWSGSGGRVAVEGPAEEMEEEVSVEVMPVIGVVEEHTETGAMLFKGMLVSPQF